MKSMRHAPILVSLATLIALTWSFAGCRATVVDLDEADNTDVTDSTDVTENKNPPPSQAVSFAADIQPLFSASCVGCHIGVTTSGVNLTTYAQVIGSRGTQYGAPVVAPGNASASPLVNKIASANPTFGIRMPQGGSLSQRQIDQVREWINAGAPNN